MSYIGQRPVVGRYIKLDQISSGFNGSETSFSMTAGSQAVFPGTARNLLLSLGGVIQEPDTNFTISGSTLTFTTAPVANTTFFAVIFGDMQSTGTPSDGTVLPASIASSGNFSFPQLTVTGTSSLGDDVTFTGANYNVVWDKSDNALEFADNAVAAFGNGSDLTITHDATNTHIRNNTGTLNLRADSVRLTDAVIGHVYLAAATGGSTDLYYDNSKKLETTSAGATVTGALTATGFATNGGGVTLNGANYNAAWVRSADTMRFYDNAKAAFGTADDLKIYHDGSKSVIEDSGTGNLEIHATNFSVKNAAGDETGIVFDTNAAVELYHDNSKKFETRSTGIKVFGNIETDESIFLDDNKKLNAGTSNDLQIFHNGTNSFISNTTGLLQIDSDDRVQVNATELRVKNAGDTETLAKFIQNGAVELYYDNSKKFETTSTGVNCTAGLDVQGSTTLQDTFLSDNDKLNFGGGNDLQIYSNGVAGIIDHVTTGTGADLILRSKTIVLRNLSNENMIVGNQNGSVNLYYDNTLRFATSVDGAAVSNISNNKGLDLNGVGNNTCIRFMSTGSSPGHAYRINFHSVTNNIFNSPCISFDKTDTSGNFDSHIGAVSDDGFHLADNKKLHLGGSSANGDLQIYHDGTDSYIDSNTGKLYVLTNNFIDIRGTNNETMIKATPNDSVQLYYDNSKKFETTSTGINVTGNDNTFNAGANAVNTTFSSAFGGAGATSVIRVKMNTSGVNGIQIQQAGANTAVAGGNHAATFFNTENAKLRLGTNNVEQFRIEDNGDLKANDTSIGSLSDSRLKKNIVDFTYDLSKFKQFKPRKFDWINPELHGNKSNVRGFVAQEIETVDSTLVGNYELYDETLTDKNPDLAIIEADDGTNIAKDSKLGTNDAMYISVIQQMLTKIETLETKVAALEAA